MADNEGFEVRRIECAERIPEEDGAILDIFYENLKKNFRKHFINFQIFRCIPSPIDTIIVLSNSSHSLCIQILPNEFS